MFSLFDTTPSQSFQNKLHREFYSRQHWRQCQFKCSRILRIMKHTLMKSHTNLLLKDWSQFLNQKKIMGIMVHELKNIVLKCYN